MYFLSGIQGLFEMADMTSPEGFAMAQQKSLSEAEHLLKLAVESPTSPEIVVLFDKMSDALCRVADAVSCVNCSDI